MIRVAGDAKFPSRFKIRRKTMTSNERGVYQPQEEFASYEDYPEEETRSRLPLMIVIALVVLAAFAGVVWLAYNQGVAHGRAGAPPIVAAPAGPMRTPPDQTQTATGTATTPYTGLKVYGEPVPPDEEASGSALAPSPEPMPEIAVVPQPGTQPAPAPETSAAETPTRLAPGPAPAPAPQIAAAVPETTPAPAPARVTTTTTTTTRPHPQTATPAPTSATHGPAPPAPVATNIPEHTPAPAPALNTGARAGTRSSTTRAGRDRDAASSARACRRPRTAMPPPHRAARCCKSDRIRRTRWPRPRGNRSTASTRERCRACRAT